jgi:hypothetical protein
MSSLMITCPRTGLDVWTGIDTDPESLKGLPHDWFHTRCPHCGINHAWRTFEAWLTDDASPVASEKRTLAA